MGGPGHSRSAPPLTKPASVAPPRATAAGPAAPSWDFSKVSNRPPDDEQQREQQARQVSSQMLARSEDEPLAADLHPPRSSGPPAISAALASSGVPRSAQLALSHGGRPL